MAKTLNGDWWVLLRIFKDYVGQDPAGNLFPEQFPFLVYQQALLMGTTTLFKYFVFSSKFCAFIFQQFAFVGNVFSY